MNFKKIAITGAAAAIMLGAAVPAFAFALPSTVTSVRNNAVVVSDVDTTAGVSGNYVSTGLFGKAKINVGNISASSSVKNDVNSTIVATCGSCSFNNTYTRVNNKAFVAGNVDTTAGVSRNFVTTGTFGKSKIDTGNISASGVVANVVNFTAIGNVTE
jgi:hypothetical protein